MEPKMAKFIDHQYLQNIADDALLYAKQMGADCAKVVLSRSQGKSITVRNSKLETLESINDQSFSITVYLQHKKGSASSSSLSLATIKKTISKACDIAKHTQADLDFALADKDLLLKNHIDLKLNHPWNTSIDNLIATACLSEQAAFAYSPKIKNSEGASINNSQSVQVYANTHGFNDYSLESNHNLSCSVIAGVNGQMQRDYDFTVARDAKNLARAEQIGTTAAKRAVDKLNPKPIKTGCYPVVLDQRVSSSIFAAFLQAINGTSLYHKTSFLLDSLGSLTFPKFVSLLEQPLLLGGLQSCAFDAEGVATKDKFIVQDGVVQSYLLSSYTARKLNTTTTANAGGVFNVKIKPNISGQQQLLEKMGNGILVTEFMGSGTNMMTGDYSRGIGGFWVQNGKITHPVAELTIAGNLLDMFKNIVAIADDSQNLHNIDVGSVLISEMMLSSSHQ